jgi:hypothetical protein
VRWADGDADELKRAERILARTQYLKGEKMADYLVTWEIDADNADSPRKAALFARNAQTRRSTWATVFHVVNKETGEVTRVDLKGSE